MDNALDVLLSSQFLLFSLGIFALTWFIRIIVEYFIPKSVSSRLWEKLILPAMPLVFGAGVAFLAKKYPYPDGLTGFSSRLIFGTVAGMFSGLVYQVIKGVLRDKVQSMVNSPIIGIGIGGPVINNNQVTTVVSTGDNSIGNRQP
jgi:hypothetical protein